MATDRTLFLGAIGLATLFCSAHLAAQTVYKQVDEQGNVSFSDSPQSAGSEEVKVRPSSGIRLPQPRQRIDPQQRERRQQEAEERDSYQRLAITQPEHDTAFWRTSGDVAIQVAIEPSLRSGHRLQLELDGETQQTQQGNTFNIQNIDRGTHEATVHVVDSDGKVLKSSELARFTVHRRSVINNPNPGVPAPNPNPAPGGN